MKNLKALTYNAQHAINLLNIINVYPALYAITLSMGSVITLMSATLLQQKILVTSYVKNVQKIFFQTVFTTTAKVKHNKPTNNKKCFTCTNNITRLKYANKKAIYNDKPIQFCKACSYYGTNIGVKKLTALEFLDCPICSKIVKYESIFCDLCQHWPLGAP